MNYQNNKNCFYCRICLHKPCEFRTFRPNRLSSIIVHSNSKQRSVGVYAHRTGVALVLVMVVLVVLTAIVCRMGFSISQWKHRQQYMIDYQAARYACESGLKYAIAMIDSLEPNYISRPNEPDFSDLFTMSDEEYRLLMQGWAEELGAKVDANTLSRTDFNSQFIDLSSLFSPADINDVNNYRNLFPDSASDSNTILQSLFVRGPYGPPWPYITEPAEIEFGDAHVKIEICDENAKLPLSWGICSDEEVKPEMKAAVVTFCEWMRMEPNDIKPLLAQLEDIKEIKPFSLNLKPVVTVAKEQISPTDGDETKDRADNLRSRNRRVSARSRRRRTRTKTVSQTRDDIGHTRDFAKLMHSPMLDIERLNRPVNTDESRTESPLKYISLWGTGQVNVNTAPRHVLEAAFTFGGDAVAIAEQVINLRKEKPFESIEELKRRVFSYSSSIEKCEPYITTQSSYFSIRSEATSGVARVRAITGIKKGGGKFQQIGIITE